MIKMSILTRQPESEVFAVKEAFAMFLEQFGQVTVPDIGANQNGIIMTLHIGARPGSVRTIQKAMTPYLKWCKDSKILTIEETQDTDLHIKPFL